MDADAVRAKVRKLRALAADQGATEHERDTARLAADRLEAKYPAEGIPRPDQAPPGTWAEANRRADQLMDDLLAGRPRKPEVCRICRDTGRVVHQGHGMKIDYGLCPRCNPKKKKS